MSKKSKKSTKSTISETEGNNQSSVSYRSKKYVFTLNNYENLQIYNIEDWLNKNASIWCFGEEIGEEGTPHLQGYMEFKNQKKWSEITNGCPDFQKAWSQNAKGNLLQNYKYTSKQLLKFYYGGFKPEKIDYKEHIETLFQWEKDILNIIKQKPDKRKIYWYHEPVGGVGKTVFQKYLVSHYKDKYKIIALSGKCADMKNGIIQFIEKNKGETPDIILINIPKNKSLEYFSYEGLEAIKDMFFYSGKYEGGMVCGASPHVFIFSNEKPPLNKMSNDRFIEVEIK